MKRHIVYRISSVLVILLAILLVPSLLIKMGLFKDLSEVFSLRAVPLIIPILPLCSLTSMVLADIYLIIRGYMVCTEPVTAIYQNVLHITEEFPDENHRRLFAPGWQYEYDGVPYSAENDFALKPSVLDDGEIVRLYINPQDPSEYRRSFATYIPNMLKALVGCMVVGFALYVVISTMFS